MCINEAIQSSPNSIISAAGQLKLISFPEKRWLFNNIYENNVIDTLKNRDINSNDLAQYIAASTVLHCVDGWKFFSNAVDNLLNGDIPNAVFMAYYAQLRALMAFFATEGVGIFNGKNFYYDDTGQYHLFSKKTHDAVRELLAAWVVDSAKSSRLLELLKYEGNSYLDWISGADIQLGTPLVQELARDWLQAWSIDLEVLGRDHDVRNEVSYRPQGITKALDRHEFRSNLSLCLEAWRISEPYAANRFALLDRYLLRQTLCTLHKNRNLQKKINFEEFVRTSIINLGKNTDTLLYTFLTSRQTEDHVVLAEARKPAFNNQRELNALPVLSRAFLLLRIASAAVENFLSVSDIKNPDLEFWWSKFGVNYGLWMSEDQPAQMSDLWADISDVINSLDNYLEETPEVLSISTVRSARAYELWQIKQFSKAGLWAIGL